MMQDLILTQNNVQWVLAELWLTSLDGKTPRPLSPFSLPSVYSPAEWVTDLFTSVFELLYLCGCMFMYIHWYAFFSDYTTVSDIRVRSISYMTEIHKSFAPPPQKKKKQKKTAPECILNYSSVHFFLFISDPCWSSADRISSVDENIWYLSISEQSKFRTISFDWSSQICYQKTAPESILKYSSVHVSLLKNDPCWSSTDRTSSTDGNILYRKS